MISWEQFQEKASHEWTRIGTTEKISASAPAIDGAALFDFVSISFVCIRGLIFFLKAVGIFPDDVADVDRALIFMNTI
ncbi:MAG: hypothetical protein M3371_11510 [Acidobacteriota bacterium]|nr:hypothetical protein [Acidobacteriota bacterium]